MENKDKEHKTKTIIDGMSVSGITMDDIQVILNLTYDTTFNFALMCKINGFVSYNESLEWGVLRTGHVGIHGVNYTPVIPIEAEVVSTLNELMSLESSSFTYKILKFMYYAMRSQLFWDGNKRTALVSANAMMMLNGLGVIHIDFEKHLEHWNHLLLAFYETNDDQEIIQWTYAHCIHGIDYKQS